MSVPPPVPQQQMTPGEELWQGFLDNRYRIGFTLLLLYITYARYSKKWSQDEVVQPRPQQQVQQYQQPQYPAEIRIRTDRDRDFHPAAKYDPRMDSWGKTPGENNNFQRDFENATRDGALYQRR